MTFTTPPPALAAIETPALLLDLPRMQANIGRMQARLAELGLGFRPHVKTAKSVEIARRMLGGAASGPITVSTLRGADEFAAAGFSDICYAVGITPNKFAHLGRLLGQGVALTVILDNLDAAKALREAASALPAALRVLIEIDTDGHRAGLPPDSPQLALLAGALEHPRLQLQGVLTHQGGSYDCRSADALRQSAERERAGAVQAATALRAAGFAAPVVSVGSTPTAMFAEHLQGVTELRAGVYVFQDLVMAGLGICTPQDIAASVLTSVIGHRRDKGWTLVDAGWMALSRDRGTASQPLDQGYGLVCEADGRVLQEYTVVAVNQEHGLIAQRSGEAAHLLERPVGALLRILPNHACATAAQHGAYQVLGDDGLPMAIWPRFGGW